MSMYNEPRYIQQNIFTFLFFNIMELAGMILTKQPRGDEALGSSSFQQLVTTCTYMYIQWWICTRVPVV